MLMKSLSSESLVASIQRKMQGIALLLGSILFLMQPNATVLASPDQEETFSRRPELGVLVLRSVGEGLSGAGLELCPVNTSSTASQSSGVVAELPCLTGFSNQDGEFTFAEIPPGEYLLTVKLEGFVPTSIGPMNINATDPMAPDRVTLVLNAACYDC